LSDNVKATILMITLFIIMGIILISMIDNKSHKKHEEAIIEDINNTVLEIDKVENGTVI